MTDNLSDHARSILLRESLRLFVRSQHRASRCEFLLSDKVNWDWSANFSNYIRFVTEIKDVKVNESPD